MMEEKAQRLEEVTNTDNMMYICLYLCVYLCVCARVHSLTENMLHWTCMALPTGGGPDVLCISATFHGCWGGPSGLAD